MVKQWLGICVAAALLAGCSLSSNNNEQAQNNQQSPAPATCSGPVVEISGADPRYEPLNPAANQDYNNNGKSYSIVQNPANFSQTGLAAIYDSEPGGKPTASGETFDPTALTAAHPTLPIPGYARITNLANGRMIVVRINDRGPNDRDRVIALSRAAADRLNTSNNTRVRIDPILVAQDGSLSGPGTVCTTVAKQTYALPSRPDLTTGGASTTAVPAQADVHPISNDTLQNQNTADSAAPQTAVVNTVPLVAGGAVAQASGTAATPQEALPAAGQPGAPITAPGSVQGNSNSGTTSTQPAATASQGFMVQAGAVNDQGRATQLQQKLSQQFNVPGTVSNAGAVFRVQLGPFSSHQEAAALQQRLMSEAQQQSFIIRAPAK